MTKKTTKIQIDINTENIKIDESQTELLRIKLENIILDKQKELFPLNGVDLTGKIQVIYTFKKKD